MSYYEKEISLLIEDKIKVIKKEYEKNALQIEENFSKEKNSLLEELTLLKKKNEKKNVVNSRKALKEDIIVAKIKEKAPKKNEKSNLEENINNIQVMIKNMKKKYKSKLSGILKAFDVSLDGIFNEETFEDILERKKLLRELLSDEEMKKFTDLDKKINLLSNSLKSFQTKHMIFLEGLCKNLNIKMNYYEKPNDLIDFLEKINNYHIQILTKSKIQKINNLKMENEKEGLSNSNSTKSLGYVINFILLIILN